MDYTDDTQDQAPDQAPDQADPLAGLIASVKQQVPGATDDQIRAAIGTVSPQLASAAPSAPAAPVAPVAPVAAPLAPLPQAQPSNLDKLYSDYGTQFSPQAQAAAEKQYQDRLNEAQSKSNWSYALGGDPSVVSALEKNNAAEAQNTTVGAFERQRKAAQENIAQQLGGEQWKLTEQQLQTQRQSLLDTRDPTSARSKLAQKVLAAAMDRSPGVKAQFTGIDVSSLSEDNITSKMPMLEKIIEAEAKEQDRKLMRVIQEGQMRRQESRDVEQGRHNTAMEGLMQQQRDVAARNADPLGVMGDPRQNPSSSVPGGAAPAAQPAAQPQPGAAPAQPGAATPAAPKAASVRDAIEQDLHGDDFLAVLKSVSPAVAEQVRAIAEGRMRMPSNIASSRGSQLQALVTQYDPDFNVNRYQTIQEFSSTKGASPGGNVAAANTVVQHMQSMAKAIDDLGNFNGIAGVLNAPINAVQSNVLKDPRQGVLREKVQAVSSELRKVFAGSGTGGLTELTKWESNFPTNASTEQLKAYLKAGVELLEGRMNVLQEKYSQNVGQSYADKHSLFSPATQAAIDKINAWASESSAKVSDTDQALIDKYKNR